MRARAVMALALLGFAAALGAAQPQGAPPADFTGTWLPDPARAQPWPATLPLTPAARTFMAGFDAAIHDPTGFCMPFGTPRNMLQTGFPLQILQTPRQLVMVLQPNLSNAEVRRIRLNEALPDTPEPTWFGTSRGHWEGATLVIETTGLREDSLIDGQGLPHSETLRVVERLSLVQDPRAGRLLVNDLELHDALSFTAPLRTQRVYVHAPQARFTEGSCVARKWIDTLWRERLAEHAQAARAAGAGQ